MIAIFPSGHYFHFIHKLWYAVFIIICSKVFSIFFCDFSFNSNGLRVHCLISIFMSFWIFIMLLIFHFILLCQIRFFLSLYYGLTYGSMCTLRWMTTKPQHTKKYARQLKYFKRKNCGCNYIGSSLYMFPLLYFPIAQRLKIFFMIPMLSFTLLLPVTANSTTDQKLTISGL